jgi:hypothetical protein
MKTRLDFVTSAEDGSMVIAETIICEECDGDTFHIFIIKGHNHLQCVACGVTFCGGTGPCEHHKRQS